jgi:hypothetical protein
MLPSIVENAPNVKFTPGDTVTKRVSFEGSEQMERLCAFRLVAFYLRDEYTRVSRFFAKPSKITVVGSPSAPKFAYVRSPVLCGILPLHSNTPL